MKKLFFLLICCAFAATSLAQSEYRQAADVALANVDKSGVRSGILYDRVFPTADLQNFNATTPSSADHYLQARSELYEATLEQFCGSEYNGLFGPDGQQHPGSGQPGWQFQSG